MGAGLDLGPAWAVRTVVDDLMRDMSTNQFGYAPGSSVLPGKSLCLIAVLVGKAGERVQVHGSHLCAFEDARLRGEQAPLRRLRSDEILGVCVHLTAIVTAAAPTQQGSLFPDPSVSAARTKG
jgi:hypothetical protein